MKTSMGDARLMSGKGVQHVKEHVKKQFETAREHGPTQVCNHMIAQTVRIAVEKPQRSLMERAMPILKNCRVTGMPHRRNDGTSWEIEEPTVSDVQGLFEECLSALGFEADKPSMDLLRASTPPDANKKSIWTRDILRIGKGD